MNVLVELFRLSFRLIFLSQLASATVYERVTYAANLGETSARITCTPTAAENIKRFKGFQKIEWSVRTLNGQVPSPERLVIFSENKPKTDIKEAGYDFDRATGDLLVTTAPLTMDDAAFFSCAITHEQGEDFQDTKLLVFSAPPESQRRPDVFKVADQRDNEEFTFHENQLSSQITEIAMCRSGYASPEPEISWVIEDKAGNRIRTIDINTIRSDDFEDFFVDFDNELGKHGTKEVDLPLKIHLSSEFHLHKFKCVVTYQLAGDNHEVVTKSYERHYPPRDVIKVIHPVSSVYLVKDDEELGDVLDISGSDVQNIACKANGYDPGQESHVTMIPSLPELEKEIIKCSSSKRRVCRMTITCAAKNSLNDEEVIQQFPLALTRFPEFECRVKPNNLLRISHPVEVDCIPANSNDQLEVTWYPASPNEKLSGGSLVKKLERSKSEINAEPSGRVFLSPNERYVAVVSIPGESYKKAEFFVPVLEIQKAGGKPTIEDGKEGVGGKWLAVENPFSGDRVGANSIIFFKWHQNAHKFTRLDDSSEEKLTNGVNRLGVDPPLASRFVKDPIGGEYIACYDIFHDADKTIMNRSFRIFDAAAEEVHRTLNSQDSEFNQCRFYRVKEQEGYWWLWIIIIVLLLISIAIGAIYLRIRSEQEQDEDTYSKIEEPLEGPSVIAVQTETAADTRAEFTYRVNIIPIDQETIPEGPTSHPPITCSSESEVEESEEEEQNCDLGEQAPMLRMRGNE